MIDSSLFWLFLMGALVLNVTPGPDMAFTLASTTRSGAAAGFAAALGVGVGSLIWSLAAAGGLGAILTANPNAIVVIRLLGGVYLLFLAARILSRIEHPPEAQGAVDSAKAFTSGVFTNLFNPKVGLFFVAFLPAFTRPDAGPIWLQIIILGGVFSVTGALVLIGVALSANMARARLAETPVIRISLHVVAALILAGAGMALLLTYGV